ncbi:Uncharacterized conserved protein, DUF58 family, contains vWF domain [Streptosporangium subroseum]|uniref:Uncharacterized conserved protein, DUF58 family, contains vWF domain n=1 Tax=Streptosporangium subroseum TaxID=106412 RepID=A0A239B3L5_9ACTN|nr:DUF58 domain-containing protein [Streptosporangium subroseum]SNS02132.1 Uncharacterized conserved protein, DUF58 family, contains vWF domain [Streptosporangium subroseum]
MWTSTPALRRAVAFSVGLCLLAVTFGRMDLLVMAVPFALGTALTLRSRPAGPPRAALRLDDVAVVEGGDVSASVTVDGDHSTLCVVSPDVSPGLGQDVMHHVASLPADVALTGTARRWGVHSLGPVRVRVIACDGLLEFPELVLPPETVRALPAAEPFVSRAFVPRADGMSGVHRSRRSGEGGELAGVRPYRSGDRLRRIDWRTTLRTREPYVNATQPERDAGIVLLLDVLHEAGGDDDGTASVLDATVRAAAAIAEHYTRQGDRVSLTEFGPRLRRLPPGTGRRHHLAQLAWLADTRAMPEGWDALGDRPPIAGPPASNALVIMLTPLLDPRSATALATLARTRRSLVAVDTLPAGLHLRRAGEWSDLAERLWRLERENTIGRLREVGVPVEVWRGSGSLDAVLRDVARIVAVPR